MANLLNLNLQGAFFIANVVYPLQISKYLPLGAAESLSIQQTTGQAQLSRYDKSPLLCQKVTHLQT